MSEVTYRIIPVSGKAVVEHDGAEHRVQAWIDFPDLGVTEALIQHGTQLRTVPSLVAEAKEQDGE